MSTDTVGAGTQQGLSWSWELDFDALARCIGDEGSAGEADDEQPGDGVEDAEPGCAVEDAEPGGVEDGVEDEEAVQRAVLAAVAERGGERIPARALAGQIAEHLPPGPDLAAWLAMATAADLADRDLAATAGSWRRITSWAQAQELAAVAQMASRAAAREEDIEVDASGRPARIPVAAAAEVSLELTMSQYAASWWADLAVDLAWRLAATGEALAAGVIDLSRARLIAEETRMLSDAAARAVEERVLASAGSMTTSSLRAALRHAVIAADPDGAERRRKEAERQAKVSLYPDQESTATLAGQRLPGVHAAAAMARIKAMARAWKASGAPGGMDLLSAKVYLGLLLGTLPLIPPAEGAPPDDPPGPPGPPEDGPGAGPGEDPLIPPAEGAPPDGPPGPPEDGPGAGPGEDPPGGGPSGDGPAGPRGSGGGDDRGAAPGGDSPSGGGHRGGRPHGSSGGPPGGDPGEGPGGGRRLGGPGGGGPGDPARGGRDDADPGYGPAPGSGQDGGWPDGGADSGLGGMPADDVPPPGDQDAPRDDDPYPVDGASGAGAARGGADGPGQDDDDGAWPGRGPGPDWPGLPVVIPPAFARPGSGQPGDGQPAGGMLDLSMSWQALAGISAEPGRLGRIGPVTAIQAGRLAGLASRNPAAGWRIIVTNSGGQAIAVTGIPRLRKRDGPAEPGAGAGLVSRVTLTIPEDVLAHPPPAQRPAAGPDPPGGILARALQAAGRALARARVAAAADAAAGGCAHASASAAYRPPPRLQEYITARDLTCRFPTCRQPAWRGDLDHTIPYDKGGLTCRCNLGGLCRTHHQLKQHLGWLLEQTAPGAFRWTTPAGRTFSAIPDIYPV